MKRLFTFGCSFTKYVWPTWADLLGVGFDEFQNWGYRGIGNRGIAERIAEAHARHQFNKNDTVIVQWSTHLRHDWYNDHQQPAGRPPGWKTNGSLFSPRNQHVHTKEWIELFFNESAYIMHTLNSIVLSQNLLEATGATWVMTSIGHLQNLGNDIDIRKEFGESLFNNDTISKSYPHLDFYKNDGNITSNNNYILNQKVFSSLKEDLYFRVQDYFQKVLSTTDAITPFITQSWLNYTETNQYHHKHAHPNSIVSGVFYINCHEEFDKIKFFNDGYKTIKQVHHKTVKECYKITTKTGKTIIISSKHKFPTIRGRISIQEGLNVGDKIHTKSSVSASPTLNNSIWRSILRFVKKIVILK
jgi:hypothetical protein